MGGMASEANPVGERGGDDESGPRLSRRTVLFGAAGIGALGVGGVAVNELFVPEQATRVEGTTELMGTPLSEGPFVGKDGHEVSGTVSLREDSEGQFLGFEEYTQTQGPDVFVYLTPAADPDTSAAIDAGERVLIDGGADGGESTKEGTFTQRLPGGVDFTTYEGVGIWCDRFSVPFGAATLEPV